MAKSGQGIARRRMRVRGKLKRTANGRPRLSVFRSGKQIYAQVIDDLEGRTLVSASSLEKDLRESLKSGGNIDAATITGVEGEITLLFDPLGVRGLRLDAEVSLTDSEVLDPLLGNPRAISNEERFDINVDLRKDFIGTPWAIGASWRYDEREPSFRLDEVSQRREPPGFARVFVEHKDVFGMTARFRVGNIADRDNLTDRTVFLDRAAGLVDFVEDRDRRFGTVYSFDIEGSF